MIKRENIFIVVFIVVYFALSVLQIINCNYLIKYDYETGEQLYSMNKHLGHKNLALFTKYLIIIKIIIAFIFGGLLFYEKIQGKQLIQKNRRIILLYANIIFFIISVIISIRSIIISLINLEYYKDNKQIINIQNFTLAFTISIICIIMLLYWYYS
jgi:hypothetical protein